MVNQLCLEIGSGEQTRVLRYIKNNLEVSWEKIAQLLGVKKRMVFFYLKEKNHLPLYRLLELCKQTNFELEKLGKLKTIEIKNFEQKEIKKPNLNEGLVEFLGALSGDGNVDPKNHRVCITCNAVTDFEYVSQIIQNSFSKLFGVQTTIVIRNGAIRCQIYSKALADYLETLGFPKGNRKNKTLIPKAILENKKLLAVFLRGVFDTDGSFHRRREKSGVIEYISCSPKFLLQIKESLQKLGLKASLSGKSVYIYDQKDVDTFFKVVKPNNFKHCLKYNIFKETGKVPLHKEIVNTILKQQMRP